MAAPAPSEQKTFTIGTRKSKLALQQTELVREALKKAHPDYEFKIFSKETAGDLNTTLALKDFASKNLWTEELEELMVAGKVDLIVHSLKGTPRSLPRVNIALPVNTLMHSLLHQMSPLFSLLPVP